MQHSSSKKIIKNNEFLARFQIIFSSSALIVGFLVDIIAIVSILFALDFHEDSIRLILLNVELNRSFAMGIWLLAFYVYIAWLHDFWKKSIAPNQAKYIFKHFLLLDLVQKFAYPWHLLPGLILCLLLIWILGFGGIIVFCLIGAFLSFIIYINKNDLRDINKYTIDFKWREFEERIELELSRNNWLANNRLDDLRQIWEVSSAAIDYGLNKYAYLYPSRASYVFLYDQKSGSLVDEQKVLVNLSTLDMEHYSFN